MVHMAGQVFAASHPSRIARSRCPTVSAAHDAGLVLRPPASTDPSSRKPRRHRIDPVREDCELVSLLTRSQEASIDQDARSQIVSQIPSNTTRDRATMVTHLYFFPRYNSVLWPTSGPPGAAQIRTFALYGVKQYHIEQMRMWLGAYALLGRYSTSKTG